MGIRQDNSILITLPIIEQFNNRNDIREYLLRQWIIETPHTKYRYFVESFDNSSRIYLERPGRLNKGCDFVIYAENAYLHGNSNDKPPDHGFILNDLRGKKNVMTTQQWSNFLLAVDEIYNSGSYTNVIQYTNSLPTLGHSFELSLKLIRWFFIEQDITYWSGLGREMFHNTIINL